MDERLAVYLRSVDAHLDDLRAQLRARYGWTRLELELDVAIEDGAPVLIVSGRVAVASLRRAIVERVTPLLLDHMTLAVRVEPLAVGRWYAIPRTGLELWAEHPSCSRRSLATELGPDDGPIGHLAHDGPGMLLCARDGTVGWATGVLGRACDPRPLARPRTSGARAAIVEAARAYLGVAYELGGASERRIDCSALVARAYERGANVLLPRNSHDQLAAGGGGEICGTADGELGDLIFMRSRRMQRLHVGIVGVDETIVHASRSRSMVIEESQLEFQLDAEWLRRVRLAEVLAWAETQVGRPFVLHR